MSGRRNEGRRSMRKLRMALGLCVKCGASRPTWAMKCEACSNAPRPEPLRPMGEWVTTADLLAAQRVLNDNPVPMTGRQVYDHTTGRVLHVGGVPTPFHVTRASFDGHPFTLAPESIVNMTTAAPAPLKTGDAVRIRCVTGNRAHEACAMIGALATVTDTDRFGRYRLNVGPSAWLWDAYELEAQPPAPPPFWLVWREPGLDSYTMTAPVRRHDSRQSALDEATRLARKHPGGRFHVLRSTEHVEVVTPEPCLVAHASPAEFVAEGGPQG